MPSQQNQQSDYVKIGDSPKEIDYQMDNDNSKVVSKDEFASNIDLYLNRLFKVGELLPWKGITFKVIGISNGVVGLFPHAVKNIKKSDAKARRNHGVRGSNVSREKKIAEHTKYNKIAREKNKAG